jgi:23S rRNA pseudouridine2604 synthase
MRKKPRNAPRHDDSISLNKYISDTGFCSRREADDYIEQGRVTINEEPAALGNRVYEGDVVEIDGEPIKKKTKTIYIALNKPEGVTTTTDQKDKTNIVEYIGHKERIFPVGRLDKESEGLIFLTNDGNIVNKILRAGNAHEKEYIVSVDKPITTDFIRQMAEGVRILRTKTKPCKVVQEAKFVFRITLIQGLNRQIRRMCDELGYKVTKLKRIRIMNVHLGNLESGRWRYLTPEEVANINKLVSDSSKTEEASRNAPIKQYIPKKKKEQPAGKPDSSDKPAKKKLGFKDFRKAGKKK